MSELTNARNDQNEFQRRLLATVSAAALLAVCVTGQTRAADGDGEHAPFWIELGGQFATLNDDEQAFLPPFVLTTPRPPYVTALPAQFQKTPPSSWDGSAKIAFEPSGTDWVLSVGILYGKSSRHVYKNQETAHPSPIRNNYNAYQDFAARSSESHTIVDFQAGKDFGLGMFGSGGNSVLSLGVRYAQFSSQRSAGIQSQPTNAVHTYHRFYASFAARRKFTGVGPSLSWDASAGLIGNLSSGSVTFDWGLNGALLFGRQRALIHHQTTNYYHSYVHRIQYQYYKHLVYRSAASPDRSKQVTVPNFGGFASVSWRYPNAKVSLGYRADFFFGPMDGGVDVAHRENVGFYGPFASVSVGIGG